MILSKNKFVSLQHKNDKWTILSFSDDNFVIYKT